MAGKSVQFVGVTEVMKAFDNKDCLNWAVWQDKAINFSYSGSSAEESRAELEEWLKMIAKRPHQAIYTLKFYEDFRGGKITAATSEHTAFNFRVNDDNEEGYRPPARFAGYSTDPLIEEIRSMRDEIKQIKEQQNKPAAIGGAEEPLETWEKILDHPLTMGLIGKIFNIDVAALDAKIAGIPGDGSIDQIVEELFQYDKDLDKHLYKLLQIAKQKPTAFKTLIGMLDSM